MDIINEKKKTRPLYIIPGKVSDRTMIAFLQHINGDIKNGGETCWIWNIFNTLKEPLFNMTVDNTRKKISPKLVAIALFTDNIVYSNDKTNSNCKKKACVSPKHNFIIRDNNKKRKNCNDEYSNSNKKIRIT